MVQIGGPVGANCRTNHHFLRGTYRLVIARVIVGLALVYPIFVLYYVLTGNVTSSNNSTRRNGGGLKVLEDLSSATAAARQALDLVDRHQVNTTTGCLSLDCIERAGHALARAFSSRPKLAWCHNNQKITLQRRIQWRGLTLIKIPKTGSSTAAGVTIRIGHNQNCAVNWRHKTASEYNAEGGLHRGSTFKITVLRDPAKRAVSTIFFHVLSRNRTSLFAESESKFFDLYLRQFTHPHQGAVSDGQGGFQLRYAAFEELDKHFAWHRSAPEQVREPDQVHDVVRRTMYQYDFVMLTERMTESLVALALLLGVPVSDVLVTHSKVAGSRYHLVHRPGNVITCVPTLKAYTTPHVQAFLDSTEWRAMNYGDYVWYAAANRSLDLTIDRLGRHDRFARAMREYERLRALEQLECAPHVQFPCNNAGEPQREVSAETCYMADYDFGCGYKCIDELIAREQQRSEVSQHTAAQHQVH